MKNMPIYVSDQTIRDMATSWPRVETISFDANEIEAPSIRPISLEAFVMLVENCEKLEHLGLFNIAFDKDEDELAKIKLQGNGSLTSLWVGYSAISHPQAVAKLLSKMCPRIETITCAILVSDIWGEVDRLMDESA